jgi:S1-C subfamily serine protease
VKEAVIVPGPLVTLSHGTEQFPADVYSWDIEQDLAVLVIPRPDLPPLAWASEEQAATALGARVFVLGAIGGAGATAVPGLVLDQSAQGMQVEAPVGTAFRGGPIVTADHKVLAVASTSYAPLGYDPGALRFSVSIGGACRTILNCGGGVRNKGTEGGPAPEPPPPPAVPAAPPAD